MVYLHRPVEQLLQNIAQRGRSYERHITAAYLNQLDDAYARYFEQSKDQNTIVVLELEDLNFIEEPLHYERIRYLLEQPYIKGYHRLSVDQIRQAPVH